MTDTSKQEDDGRIRIWVNSGAKMSRGKYAAAAVHAAMTAAGVHPGVPVIVLGGQRDQIEHMRTVIHDAGRTEVEPGTATAGTEYVFEQAHTPTDDEREARQALDILHRYAFGSNEIGREQVSNMVEIISDHLRRTAVQEPEPPLKSAWHATPAVASRRREPQAEPTDAYARAVWDALGPGITVGFEYEELRAALRAAYEEGKKR